MIATTAFLIITAITVVVVFGGGGLRSLRHHFVKLALAILAYLSAGSVARHADSINEPAYWDGSQLICVAVAMLTGYLLGSSLTFFFLAFRRNEEPEMMPYVEDSGFVVRQGWPYDEGRFRPNL
ncbi:MAG: hypothetical protein AB203_01500 [Parcubacteria bacterium C7867-008]|nr:MAG: hypothetical protein AB203_01500 [Parcubacteria bacterium C7867-008]